MKLSQSLQEIFDKNGPEVTVEEILNSIQSQFYGFLFLILSLPVALPFTPPGVSIPFGIGVLLVAWQFFTGKERPSLPGRLLRAKIDVQKNKKFVNLMLRTIRFAENFLRPRMHFVYHTILTPKINAAVIAVCAILMSLPIPVTNTPPGIAIAMIGLGMIQDDGLFGLMGLLLAICSLIAFIVIGVLILMFGWEIINLIEPFIESFLPF